MTEIKIFVDIDEKSSGTLVICEENAKKLGVQNGGMVDVVNDDNLMVTSAKINISDQILDFAGRFSKDILDKVKFDGVELTIRPSSGKVKTPSKGKKKKPTSKLPQTKPVKEPIPIPAPVQPGARLAAPSAKTMPTSIPEPQISPPPPQPTPQPQYFPPPPQPTPQTQYSPPPPQPTPQPQYTPPSQLSPMPQPPSQYTPSQPTPGAYGPPPAQRAAPAATYANAIDINMLQSQKNGIILSVVVDSTLQGGRVQLSPNLVQSLGLGQGMLIAWEDPVSRSVGSARIDVITINPSQIRMSLDTKEDTNIQSNQIVVYSTEPPIHKTSQIMLEVHSQPNLMGFCQVSPRIQHTLSIQSNDVIAFSDELTGAVGAGKVQIVENVPDNAIYIDSEILEASGIGSFEVTVTKNQRQIIPLQSVSLGIAPISGENMWQIISMVRTNVEPLKIWLSNYIIFKGIKLRWAQANVACSIIQCVPDLTGDILAQITSNTTLSLAPVGLIPFNAILIIDISRSMMARDVLVTNIAPAIEGIKAAMESREIQEFLVHFKDGVNIPRRISAAFAAVLFLSEKVGRGFGEKVSVIRFADEAQVLPFGGSYYMDSASGKKGVLEDAARVIVDRIGNAYGQATNMGQAMVAAHQVLNEFDKMSKDQPTMIVLLTDGVPTDGDAFFNEIRRFSENPNVVIYVIGLGNPDDNLMNKAAALCGGEYYKPENAGDLLVWYSKRARDLTVKLKAHRA
ncbi:MAG: VWA domain-containing protein [Promethearchaeota archaeon]